MMRCRGLRRQNDVACAVVTCVGSAQMGRMRARRHKRGRLPGLQSGRDCVMATAVKARWAVSIAWQVFGRLAWIAVSIEVVAGDMIGCCHEEQLRAQILRFWVRVWRTLPTAACRRRL